MKYMIELPLAPQPNTAAPLSMSAVKAGGSIPSSSSGVLGAMAVIAGPDPHKIEDNKETSSSLAVRRTVSTCRLCSKALRTFGRRKEFSPMYGPAGFMGLSMDKTALVG